MPDIEFPDGLRIIAIEKDYQELIEVGHACSCVISMYMDHLGVNVHQWILDEKAEVCTPEDKFSGIGEVIEDLHAETEIGIELDEVQVQGNMDNNIANVDCIPINKTLNGAFLN